jgi:threonine dehydratase
MEYFPKIEAIKKAALTIRKVTEVTPLMHSIRLSKLFNANIHLKREDLHRVRSYKIRGAFNKISTLPKEKLKKGVVCASAGNHAQGVAFACNHLTN